MKLLGILDTKWKQCGDTGDTGIDSESVNH